MFVVDFNSNSILQISLSLSSTIATYTFNSALYGSPYSLNSYNNVMYVGTLASVVLTLSTTGVMTRLVTGCGGAINGISYIAFDSVGNMLQSCFNTGYAYVYSPSGSSYSYSGISIYLTGTPYYADWDTRGSLAVMYDTAVIYFYN